MKCHAWLCAATLAVGVLSAQELAWEFPGPTSTSRVIRLSPYEDYDHDGYQDCLVSVLLDYLRGPYRPAVQIVSGRDGRLLHQYLVPGSLVGATYVGDMDGDGVGDFVVQGGDSITAVSAGRDQILWTVPNPDNFASGFGETTLGNLDLDGDGRIDIVTFTWGTRQPTLYVFDNAGRVLYKTYLYALGYAPQSLAAMGDMDGDGCDDFILGCIDPQFYGTLALISGRTGRVLRLSQGLTAGDMLCGDVANVGDIDRDGWSDYAAVTLTTRTNNGLVVFSGRTGGVLRTWPQNGERLVPGLDADRDGIPDLIVGGDYPVVPPNVYGRLWAYSGRDGGEIVTWSNSSGAWHMFQYACGLGVQPSSGYPALAWLEPGYTSGISTGMGRVRALRLTPLGQGPIAGAACASVGAPPLIGVRQFPTSGHLNLSGALPGACAVLLAAPAGQTSYLGVPLPIALDPLGFYGCSLHVGPLATVFSTVGTAGLDRGFVSIDLGRNLAGPGAGTALAAQWLVFEPSTAHYQTTAKHTLRIQ